MTIEGKNKLELTDILVGEVWLVAGQSNMQRLLSETDNGEQRLPQRIIPRFDLFNVSRQLLSNMLRRRSATWASLHTGDSQTVFCGRLLLRC